MLQAREEVLRRFRPVLNAQGLTEQQWRIIRALHERGTLEPRELGLLCAISSPSMAGVLSRMEQLGLIHRERAAYDQRRVFVSLSPLSLKHLNRLAPQIEATYRQIEQDLGGPLAADLTRVLEAVVAALHQHELPVRD